MKFFALTFVTMFLFVGTISTESDEKWKDDIQKWFEECAKELVISEDKVKEYEAMTEPAMDQLGMCLTECILEKAGLIVDGKLHEESMNAVVKEFEELEGMETIPEITKKCYIEGNAKTEPCETAGVFSKCMYDEMQAIESTT